MVVTCESFFSRVRAFATRSCGVSARERRSFCDVSRTQAIPNVLRPTRRTGQLRQARSSLVLVHHLPRFVRAVSSFRGSNHVGKRKKTVGDRDGHANSHWGHMELAAFLLGLATVKPGHGRGRRRIEDLPSQTSEFPQARIPI